MERLTFYDKKAKTFVVKASVISEEFHTPDNEYVRYGEIVDKLAEYENAEEQGLMVRLKSPVSLNSILFRPVCYKNHKYNKIYVLKVTEIKQNKKGVFFRIVDTETSIQSRFYQPSDIGTKIFLTEAEALQALKERE